MNKKKLLIAFVIIPIFFISCAQATHKSKSKSYQSKIQPDPTYLTYPKYRIDHLINKICITGTGDNKDKILSILTEIFMKDALAPIRVVEPGNIESILKGRIIEYETGLTKDESQALSQMLQVDHILIFNEKTSPHQDYIYGGRCYSQISLKIISTISGEIIFQTSKQWGIFYPDPRPTFSSISPLPSQNTSGICMDLVKGELKFAVGSTITGLAQKDNNPTGPCIVQQPMINSPSYKAGIKEGDKILEIAGIKVNIFADAMNLMANVRIKQGDTIKYRLERAGKILDLDIKYPVIPMHPVDKRHKETKKKGQAI